LARRGPKRRWAGGPPKAPGVGAVTTQPQETMEPGPQPFDPEELRDLLAEVAAEPAQAGV